MVRILYVEHNTDGSVGGSHYALLDILRNLDRSRFEPVVVFFEEHSLLQAFRETGAEVIVGRPGRGPVTLAFTALMTKVLKRFVHSLECSATGDVADLRLDLAAENGSPRPDPLQQLLQCRP